MTHPADSRLANNLAQPLGLLTPSGGRLIVSFAAGSSRRESSWVEASCHPRFLSSRLQKTLRSRWAFRTGRSIAVSADTSPALHECIKLINRP